MDIKIKDNFWINLIKLHTCLNSTIKNKLALFFFLLIIANAPAIVNAQSPLYHYEYKDTINSSTKIESLKDDLFGDSISYVDGGVRFQTVDIQAKTQVSLPMTVGRKMLPTGSAASGFVGTQELIKETVGGDWMLDIPHAVAVYDNTNNQGTNWDGWVTGSVPRCSAGFTPPSRPGPYPEWQSPRVLPHNFWTPLTISIPGYGEEAPLQMRQDGIRPSDGLTYTGTTKSGWRISCIASIKNGGGEGYLVSLPDGAKYYFDWIAVNKEQSLYVSTGQYGVTINRASVFLFATKAVDKFGRYLTYNYNTSNPFQLSSIKSSDGQEIKLIYDYDNKLSTATSGNRMWKYEYVPYPGYANRKLLSKITLPDSSLWKYDYTDIHAGLRSGPLFGQFCNFDPGYMTSSGTAPASEVGILKITHPSGAIGEFTFRAIVQGYNNVDDGGCFTYPPSPGGEAFRLYGRPKVFKLNTLVSKKVSGASIGTKTWLLSYAPSWSYSEDCTSGCANTSTTTITASSGLIEKYKFGNDFQANRGRLLSISKYSGANELYRLTNNYLASVTGQPFPDLAGDEPNKTMMGVLGSQNRPLVKSQILQDGVIFTKVVDELDRFARPLSVSKASSFGYSRIDSNTYHDNLSKWVLGQTAKTIIDGIVASETAYDTLARPITYKSFGKLQKTLTYNADGTIATVKDGNAKVTSLSNWKRGIPQAIVHPVASGAPAEIEKAVVNDDGTIASVTDENGFATKYAYDPIGRLELIDYPDGDSVAWTSTGLSFGPYTTDSRYGLPAGHWLQIIGTGNSRKVTAFDALWRPVVEETYDNADAANTRSIVVKRYDAAGRLEFQSYPVRSLTNWADTTLKGTHTTYDALDRPLLVKQDSELGVLTTKTEYLAGFQTRVTNPRGYATTTKYLAYDQPTTDYPLVITHPEGAYTYIGRDVFGKPTYVVRRNGPGDVTVRRTFVYDANQQLCKTIEPETDATVMAYDAAGNLAWSASGKPFASRTDCNTADVAIASRTTRSYDARNRLQSLVFPDHRGDTTYTYTPDGQPASLTADNGGGNLVTTTYAYNRRRLLTGERMVWGAVDQALTYGYDANGHLASQIYPTGGSIAFAPNALGQPTQAGIYATDVTYHPNGAVARFVYGNGIVHTLQQNDRQLPERSKDAYGTTVIALDDSYDYDKNGNVAGISDALPGNRGNRTMSYDGLDRLTQATSPMFGVGGAPTSANYAYDVVDNLTHVKVLSAKQPRDHYYCYDSHWRLDFVRTGANCSGSASPAAHALNYDVQGNVSGKDNAMFDFDYGNRLRSAQTAGSTTTYVYDGLGRRVRDATGTAKYSLYSRSGELAYANDLRTNKRVINVYLAGSLVSELEYDVPSAVWTTRYMHTDALDSVVARSSAGRSSVIRTEYEPFGAMINRVNYDRPAYAGHVMDAATGLTYMQQRYYDPTLGRFLSVDPVTANSGTVANFNRYWYANNNPYRFTDPDGRQSKAAGKEIGRWTRALWDNNGDFEKAQAQVEKQREMDRSVAETIVDLTAAGGAKDAVEISYKLATEKDALGQATGSVAGDIAAEVTEHILDGKIGKGAAEAAGAVTGKVVGDTVESSVDGATDSGNRSSNKSTNEPKPVQRSEPSDHRKL